jgi:hypothetical protein
MVARTSAALLSRKPSTFVLSLLDLLVLSLFRRRRASRGLATTFIINRR